MDRSQLLASAERAIEACGPDATMDQIAAEAQVTKPILYRTIGDKAALVDALSDVLVDRIGHAIDGSVVASDEPRAAFTASIRAYLAAVDADRGLYLFVNASGQRTGPLRSRIDRSAEQMIEMFTAARGSIGSSTAARTWSHSIVGALQTVTLMWIDEESNDDDEERSVDDLAGDVTALLWPGVMKILQGAVAEAD